MDAPEKPKKNDKPSQTPKSEKSAGDKVNPHAIREKAVVVADKVDKKEVFAPEKSPEPRAAPRSGESEQIVYLNLSELHAFKDHPFGVRDDKEMQSLVESVRAKGVNQPALVRPPRGWRL